MILNWIAFALVVLTIGAIVRAIERSKKRRLGMPEIALVAADGKLTVLQDLVQGGADVNARGPNGETALMMAARNGHLHIVEWLLESGARTDYATPGGATAASVSTTPEIRTAIEAASTAKSAM
jgi:ankyrin repeat protein